MNGESRIEAPAGPVPDDEIPPDLPVESRVVEAHGVDLHVVEGGPRDGKLLVLLHGFPEFWYGWHDVIRPLVNEGFRVVVPDQRGYNLSEKPPDVASYGIDDLARDVIALIDGYDRETAAVAGHDWGGGVGWWLALHHGDRLSEFVAVNAPHPTAFRRTLRRSWSQRLKSWYILGFQLPWLPERVLRAGDWRPLVHGMKRSSLPGTFTPDDFERYRRAWSRPGAFTAMVNWYRAAAREAPSPDRTTVDVPTLVVWGLRDEFLRRSMAHDSAGYCAESRVLMLQESTHWVTHEEPLRVADAIADHATPLPPRARE